MLVSHGAAIRMAAAALLGDTVETWYVPNAGLVVLRREAQGWVLESWDTAEPVRGDVTRRRGLSRGPNGVRPRANHARPTA